MPFIVGPGGDLVGPGGGHVGPAEGLAPALPSATLHQLFTLGQPAFAELHQLFDLGVGIAPSASLHQFFDLVGLSGATLHQPFDLLGELAYASLHQRFDIWGVPTAPPSPLWQPLMVFDKGGAYLGSIRSFNVIRPPVRYLRSLRVSNEGGMTFNLPRGSAELGLVAADRLVMLQSRAGEAPWWGAMNPRTSAGGIVEVECLDAFAILRDGPKITLDETVDDGTPATAVYAKIVGLHNDARAALGEVQWGLDLQGSRAYRGDISFSDQDTLACLDDIIRRSRTEIAWRVTFAGGRLVPTLMVRDAFAAGAGAAFHDGAGGNVLAGPQVIEDPSPMVFGIHLTGQTTDLAACLPEWAQWAAKDVTPEITVSVDPGAYRMRVMDESVDWGLSKAAVAAQCNAIVDWLTEFYHSFLRAVHDIEGRPWHEGWAYLGPPDIYEPMAAGKDSLSRRAWRTRLELVELQPDQPASAVMLSDKHSITNLREWLVVLYNRQTGVQSVGVVAIPSAAGISLVKWASSGTITIYHVSGGRIVGTATLGATGAYVDPYNIRVYDPVKKQYRNLRRIINGTYALAWYVDPADKRNSFVDMGVGAAIDQSSGDGSSLIDKIYGFERLAIENWDPRRDGIGQLLARPTIYFGEVTTRPRWHITSFNVGGGANTSLLHGIGAGSPGDVLTIEVESVFGFPDPYTEPDAFPWTGAFDEGLDEEQFTVVSPADMQGTEWTVRRGANGTDAILHEPGAPVRRISDVTWDGYPWPGEVKIGDTWTVGADLWPEGVQWATDELAYLSKEKVSPDLHITHASGDQLTIDYGSTHATDVATEGRAGRWVGTDRIVGWSTGDGETECVGEWIDA
jgi:hypothetical protein